MNRRSFFGVGAVLLGGIVTPGAGFTPVPLVPQELATWVYENMPIGIEVKYKFDPDQQADTWHLVDNCDGSVDIVHGVS